MTRTPRTFDGHNDTLLAVHRHDGDETAFFADGNDESAIDLPRARDANLGAGFFAVFVPNEAGMERVQTEDGYHVVYPPAVEHERAKEYTHDVLAALYRLERAIDGFRVARTVGDVEACLDGDALGAIPHLEGAAAVAPDLSNLDFLYAAGVRSVGLTWSRPNAFAHGVPFEYPGTPDTGPGLTDEGRALVDACNDRGIVLDLAHLNDAGFWDVAERTSDPFVVSHTAAHGICPATRNATDDQLDAIAESGGVVGVSFAVENLREDGQQDPETPVSAVADHVEYVADRVGVEHVAFGSDFDGATVPDAVGDVTGLRGVYDALRERGFAENELRAVARENWLRVLRETWR